nr:hypothetical protein [Pseudomonas sp. 1079]
MRLPWPWARARVLACYRRERAWCPPGGSLKLPVKDVAQAIPADAQVHFKYINDYGAFSVPQRAPLKF